MATEASRKAFLDAASGGTLKQFKKLAKELEEHAHVKDEKGRTALHLAAAAGNTKICQLLIRNFELDVNGTDDEGNTPLILAILENRSYTTSYLINNGADIMTFHDRGFTPLHYAAEKGNEEIVQLLISKGATLDLNSEEGTPLQCAAASGKKEALKVLLDNKANPNSAIPFYFPPLSLSIIHNSFECFQLLLKAGANPNLSSYGKTPLIFAACQGKTEMIKCLLKFEANPNAKDAAGLTPLEHAAMHGKVEAVQILFPVTSQLSYFPIWSVSGIMWHVSSDVGRIQRDGKVREYFCLAKSNGQEAFNRKDYEEAIVWFNEANIAVPGDASVLSNRSLCWARLKKGNFALCDAQKAVELKPDWAVAHYREGAAWMLLKNYSRATDAFSEALKLDPDNKEVQEAHGEAVEAEFGVLLI